jgi:rhodanese-related sulfurtransferase
MPRLHATPTGGVIVRTAVLLAAATAAGVVDAAWRGLPWTPDLKQIERRQERREMLQVVGHDLRARHAISLDELRSRMEDGETWFIDARPAKEYEKAHLHVDTGQPVLNIEPGQVDRELDRLFQLQVLPLVLYCTSDDCDLADELMLEMEKLGFDLDLVKVYYPGWEGIRRAGLPTAGGPDTWLREGSMLDQGMSPDASHTPDEE